MRIKPIFPQSEQTFIVVECTPYLQYETVFSGSATECLSWCKEHRRSSVNELYKLIQVEEDLSVIILSITMLDAARSTYIERTYK